MPDAQPTILTRLKAQVLEYKRQSLVLAALLLLLLVVVVVQFPGGAPRQSRADEPLPPSRVPVAAAAATADPATAEPLALASWSEIQTSLKRLDLFTGPWLTLPQAIDFDGDHDGVPNVRDNCPDIPNRDQSDSDQDGIGDLCEDDDGGFPDVRLNLKYIEIPEATGDVPTAYINKRYYRTGDLFRVEGHTFKLISIHRNKAVIQDRHGNTKTLQMGQRE